MLAVETAVPAEIVGQVLGRDAAERLHPSFEAAGVGVDVLDVIDAEGPLARAGVERHVQDAALIGDAAVALGAVRDEHIGGIDARRQHALDGGVGTASRRSWRKRWRQRNDVVLSMPHVPAALRTLACSIIALA